MKKENMKRLVSLIVVLSFQVALADNVNVIVGKNDLVTVNADATNIPSKFKKIVNAIGIMGVGCTATHVGDGYVVTAGHCIGAYDYHVDDQPCGSNLYDINWGYREGVEPYLVSKCERIISAYTSDTDGVDYALLKVSPAPPYKIKLDFSRLRSKVGTIITIFSHVDEKPLSWSKNCRIQSVEQGVLSMDYFHHVCDTMGGSSGALIINPLTLKAIGIHGGGVSGEFNTEGVTLNYGTYLFKTPLLDLLQKLLPQEEKVAPSQSSSPIKGVQNTPAPVLPSNIKGANNNI